MSAPRIVFRLRMGASGDPRFHNATLRVCFDRDDVGGVTLTITSDTGEHLAADRLTPRGIEQLHSLLEDTE